MNEIKKIVYSDMILKVNMIHLISLTVDNTQQEEKIRLNLMLANLLMKIQIQSTIHLLFQIFQ